MTGRTPLVLAAFLFGVGASGLLFLATAERGSWGPFQPPAQPTGIPKVIVYEVPPSITPPPLHDLMNGVPATELVARVQPQTAAPVEMAAPEVAETPEPTPTPPPPLRIFGVSSDDPGVSAAAATPTPITLRIGGIAADSADGTSEPTAEASETPEPSATPEAAEETPAAQ